MTLVVAVGVKLKACTGTLYLKKVEGKAWQKVADPVWGGKIRARGQAFSKHDNS
jgi:hypothetical protein